MSAHYALCYGPSAMTKRLCEGSPFSAPSRARSKPCVCIRLGLSLASEVPAEGRAHHQEPLVQDLAPGARRCRKHQNRSVPPCSDLRSHPHPPSMSPRSRTVCPPSASATRSAQRGNTGASQQASTWSVELHPLASMLMPANQRNRTSRWQEQSETKRHHRVPGLCYSQTADAGATMD